MPSARRRGRALLAALYTLLCGVGFFGVSAAIRPLMPTPNEYGFDEKFEYFAEHKDEFDVLAIGSSRVWRGFIPEDFDAEMELRGESLRSYNLGVGGMRVWEMDYLLRQVLALKPAKLRYVFIEGGDWDPEFASRVLARPTTPASPG